MRSRRRTLEVLALLCVTGACRVGPDLSTARLDVTLETSEPVSPAATLRVRFSHRLQRDSVAAAPSLAVVHPMHGGCPCLPDQVCLAARCHAGALDDHQLGKLERGVTTELETIVLDAELDEQDRLLLLRPRVFLPERRLVTLWFDSALRDIDGRRLGRARVLVVRTGAQADLVRAELVPPAPFSVAVPPNLARLVIEFAEPVVADETSFQLVGPDGEAGLRRGSQTLCRGRATGTCLVLQTTRSLTPIAGFELRLTAELRSVSGKPVFLQPATFGTAATPDRQAPQVVSQQGVAADGCVVIRVQTRSPSDLVLAEQASLGREHHELALRGPLGALELRSVTDERVALDLMLPPASSAAGAVRITEVLANPLGAEPAQELVELTNHSSRPLRIDGWWIDAQARSPFSQLAPADQALSGILAPGQAAVVVGRHYVLGGPDPLPAQDSLLVRLGGVLGGKGLSNDGQSLWLRDAGGQVVSSYGGFSSRADKAGAGLSAQRIGAGCDVQASWTAGLPTPGLPTTLGSRKGL